MSSSTSQNSHGKSTDLSNILQGDDSNHGLNSSINNTPSDFTVPVEQHNTLMDSRNQGDHDATGRFSPYGGPPNIATNQPGHPSFTRQTGPLMGGKHVDDDDDEELETGNAPNGPTLSHVDPRVPELAHHAAPKLGEKRTDEPHGNDFGLDPSQGKLKMD